MDGIVIWSDPTRGKAIVWCSDQGELAFILSKSDMLGSANIPVEGTLISFHATTISGQRRCKSVVAVAHGTAPELTHALKEITLAPLEHIASKG